MGAAHGGLDLPPRQRRRVGHRRCADVPRLAELKANKLWSTVVIVGAILATAATWLYIAKEALNG